MSTNGEPSTSGRSNEGTTKAIIKNVDMAEDMQQRAVDTASSGLEQYNVEKDAAMFVKKEFDRLYGTTWHCVVGKTL
ncbi:MAG: Dynein light chain [Tremellales sp. Tagirdzhanova-0007]|nr:MAG: Dynein light chain [Tremellales sp. Tagirdzhanova-0007]